MSISSAFNVSINIYFSFQDEEQERKISRNRHLKAKTPRRRRVTTSALLTYLKMVLFLLLQFLSFFYCFLNKSQKQNKIDEHWQNVYLNITKHGCYFLVVSIINILTFSSVCKFKRKKSSPVRTKILKFTTK